MEYDVADLIRRAITFRLTELNLKLEDLATFDLEWVKENIVPKVVSLLYYIPETKEQIQELVHKQWADLKGEKVTREILAAFVVVR